MDSGPTQCLFHSHIGAAIGPRIDKGKLGKVTGINGDRTEVYLHNVSLYVPGGHILKIEAGFTDKLPVGGVLGMTGFFDHFKVTFDPTTTPHELERFYRA